MDQNAWTTNATQTFCVVYVCKYPHIMTTKKQHTNKKRGHAETPKTPDSVNQLESKAQEYLQGWQRCQADFENYRKEEDKNRQLAREFLKATIVSELIPVLDNFDVAMKHSPGDSTSPADPTDSKAKQWLHGIGHIHKQLVQLVESWGVRIINPVGEPFDPLYHEALDHDGAGHAVTQVVHKGYLFQDRVLRPAKVRVGTQAAPSQPTQQANQT